MHSDTSTNSTLQLPCRLCQGTAQRRYSLRLLGKYEVGYFECIECGSLETEPPFWISEAYGNNNLAMLDTGAAQRNLANLAAVYVAAKLLRMRNILDYGGGDGLLCRLLRDYGINCFVGDKYADATYASAFTQPSFSRPDMLLAFEVVEHFEYPQRDFQSLFGCQPKAILGSTGIYDGQGGDWWYLTPESGQHVFFYSTRALHAEATRNGFELVTAGSYFLMFHKDVCGSVRRVLMTLMLNRFALRLIGAAMRLLPTPGVSRDFDAIAQQRTIVKHDSE